MDGLGGNQRYGSEVDAWKAGLVAAELLDLQIATFSPHPQPTLYLHGAMEAITWYYARHMDLGELRPVRGVDRRLREETGLPIATAEEPLSSVALGTGAMLADVDLLRKISLD